jgi:hypothetical protein
MGVFIVKLLELMLRDLSLVPIHVPYSLPVIKFFPLFETVIPAWN